MGLMILPSLAAPLYIQAEVDISNCLELFSDSTGDAEPLPVSGYFGG